MIVIMIGFLFFLCGMICHYWRLHLCHQIHEAIKDHQQRVKQEEESVSCSVDEFRKLSRLNLLLKYEIDPGLRDQIHNCLRMGTVENTLLAIGMGLLFLGGFLP